MSTPSPVPLARRSEPLRTVAAAGALGFAACVLAGFSLVDVRFGTALGASTAILAWFWLRLGARTPENAPGEKIYLAKLPPLLRLGVGAAVFGMLNGGFAGAAMLLGDANLGDAHPERLNDVVLTILGGFALGTTFGAMIWIPAATIAFLTYGLPLWWASSKMPSKRADAVDASLRVAHGIMVVPALFAFFIALAALGNGLGAAPSGAAHAPGLAHVLVTLLVTLGAILVPAFAGAAAHRRLTVRRALLARALGGDPSVRLVPISESEFRDPDAATVGPGTVPTHVLVRISSNEANYRISAETHEELAIYCDATGSGERPQAPPVVPAR